MLFKLKYQWYKEILLILLIIVFIPPFSSSSNAYELGRDYFHFRDTNGYLNFTCTRHNVNVSGNMTLLTAQMWIPRDDYPAELEEVKLFFSRATNETQKREWYWNEHFLTYAEEDLNQLLSKEFPEIFLRNRAPTKYYSISNVSSVFYFCKEGDPHLSSFYPGIAGIFFNVTYLPFYMNYYVEENATSEDWENLERWEATVPLIEAAFRSKWYIDNFTINYGGVNIGYYITNPFLEPILGLVVLVVILLTLGKKRKKC
jgi:hypothetical protein